MAAELTIPSEETIPPTESDAEFEQILENSFKLIANQELVTNLNKENLEIFKTNYRNAFYWEKAVFKDGGNLEGVIFKPCETPAHNFFHVRNAVLCQLILLPGFLKAQQNQKISYDQAEVLPALVGELFHDLGWLPQKQEQDQYRWAGEKFFDHCDQSRKLAPIAAQVLGFKLNQQQNQIMDQTIAATEFNKKADETADIVCKKGAKDRLNQLNELTWAADFLSYFSHQEDVPDIILDLYRETYARVKGLRGTAALETNAAAIDQQSSLGITRVKEMLHAGLAKVGQLKFPGLSDGIQNVQDFTAGEFLSTMLTLLDTYLSYSDYYFQQQTPKENNWIRENYYINLARIETIQEIAKQMEPINPLVFLEGSMMEADFINWLERLENKRIATKTTKAAIYGKNIDLRVLGLGFAKETPAISRLTTHEIYETLGTVPAEKRVAAAAELLAVFMAKNQKPGGFKELWLNLSPYAYTLDEKGTMNLTEKQWFDALKLARENNPGVKLKLTFCLRRDRKEMEPDGKKAFLAKAATLKTRAQELGQELQVTIGGFESAKHPLSQDIEFIDELAKQGIRIFVYAGQIKIKGTDTVKLAAENMQQAVGLAVKHAETARVIVVGLQALDLIDQPTRDSLIHNILWSKPPCLLSCSSDLNSGFVPDIHNHPYALYAAQIKQRYQQGETLPFPNLALCAPQEFLPSSIPIDIFRLLMAAAQRGEAMYGIPAGETRARENYRQSSSQLNEEQKRKELLKSVRENYMAQFYLFRETGKNFFQALTPS